jgi:hypothetical protein
MYALGLGVEQSYPTALKYYRKAADLGNGKAAFNLGRMYEFGEGMPPDTAQAKYWYVRAVELGEQEAEQRLLALEGGAYASRFVSADLLTEALGVPPLRLAQSVSSIKNVMAMLPLAEAGVALQLPDGEVNKTNVAAVRDELEARLAIYEQAIDKRGVEVLLNEYAAVADKCTYSQSSWASLIANGYDHVFVSQNGSEVMLEVSKKRRRNNPERSASGIIVENAVSLTDPMNSDYIMNGEYLDGIITIHPDVESILQAWPDFIQPPSRANLSSCVVTLMPVGYSRKSPADAAAAGNRFEALAGKGTIYIHRAKKFAASELTFRVELNEDMVGPMAPNEYYRLDLDPGEYVVTVWSRDIQDNLSIGNLEVTLQANEVSFIEVKPKMGWKAFKMSVEEIPADVGHSLILKGRAVN